MKSCSRFLLRFSTLLLVCLVCYLAVIDYRDTRFVVNILNKDSEHQLIYERINPPFYDTQFQYLFTSRRDTTYLDIEIDSLLKQSLFVIDSSFKEGVLYSLKEPLKGFMAFHLYESELSNTYRMLSDYIYIRNSLYSLELTPLLQKSDYARLREDFRGAPKSVLHKWLLEEYFYPYEKLDSVIHSRRRLPSWGTDCLLYTYDSHPDIRLLYKQEGFSDETKHIIQYPVIILSKKQIPEGSIIRIKKESIYFLRNEYRFTKPYSLIKYSNGYLFCISDSRRYPIPSEYLLDSLVSMSNAFIKKHLSVHGSNIIEMPNKEE